MYMCVLSVFTMCVILFVWVDVDGCALFTIVGVF